MIMMIGGLGGMVVFLLGGHVNWFVALPCAAFNIAGNFLGSNYAMRFGTGLVRRFLIFSLALLFASLVWKFWIDQ